MLVHACARSRTMIGDYRSRGARTMVAVKCRMHSDGAWGDMCIHSVSARDLIASSGQPPSRGSYVDIRRGTLVIIGHITWIDGWRFGVRTQDKVSAAALVAEPVLRKRPSGNKLAPDRRSPIRSETEGRTRHRVEQNRVFALAFQFVCVVVAGVSFAAFAGVQVYHVLQRPFDKVAALLAGG
jgi:hypothetical protein